MEESKATRGARDSRSTLAGSSPLLSERFRRPISPLHTEAFQVGWISQVLSVTTLSFSPSLSMMWESGMPVTDPSWSWIDRVRYALPPRLSLSNLASYFGKYTGLALTNFAPLIELPVLSPALVNSRKDSAPVLRRSLSW